MGLRINSNISSIIALRNLNATDARQAKSLERLSTGLRIVHPLLESEHLVLELRTERFDLPGDVLLGRHGAERVRRFDQERGDVGVRDAAAGPLPDSPSGRGCPSESGRRRRLGDRLR